MPDWDAARYHRLSEPQLAWGRTVLARLGARPGERVLDIGCGTGRLTAELSALPGILVAGLDRSAAMLAEAAAQGLPAAVFVRGDGAALPFAAASFDRVFSTATFHWIRDHDRLFAEIHQVLVPGGRLVAQCGGGPNLARLIGRAHDLMRSPAYAPYFGAWADPWLFASVDETTARLERAGFESIEVSLEAAPTRMADAAVYRDFISCVCVRHHVDTLPAPVRPGFVAALAGQASADDPPFTLDYWRLNIAARKAHA
jgi:trans-aconitate 2-methyltransferase